MPDRSLPALLEPEAIRRRLQVLFPDGFPARPMLVGETCANAVFVFLYGGFVEGHDRFLRPSFIYRFTKQQVKKTSAADRSEWASKVVRSGYRPSGERWYADNSREGLRDDLFRNRLIPLGIVKRRQGVPTTSSKPIYYLTAHFAQLLKPQLQGRELQGALAEWRTRHLNPATLSRMLLRTSYLSPNTTDVLIDFPDHTRVRVGAGPSSIILKSIVEQFAPRYLKQPVVLWISASDRKVWPQFEQAAATVGLRFSASAELPDLILADLAEDSPVKFIFCEVVATDGAITSTRKEALLQIVGASDIPVEQVEFLSAFADREDAAFRKNVGSLADEALVWFHSEPGLLIRLVRLPPPRPT